jgi:hypothetical protein
MDHVTKVATSSVPVATSWTGYVPVNTYDFPSNQTMVFLLQSERPQPEVWFKLVKFWSGSGLFFLVDGLDLQTLANKLLFK